jgi:microcystin-dependent protein
MVSTFTPNKNLEQPANNDYIDSWDIPVNADWTAIDLAFGGGVMINLAGLSGNRVLVNTPPAAPEWRALKIIASGLPTAATNLVVPAGVGGLWVVRNSTTGGFAITISSAAGGALVPILEGTQSTVTCDGTATGMALAQTPAATPATAVVEVGDVPPATPLDNMLWWNSAADVGGGQLFIRYADPTSTQWVPAAPPFSAGVPPGAVMDFAGPVPPVGWLVCDGASYATSLYPNLFNAIRYTYGGSGGTFNVPDLGGRVAAGRETSPSRLTVAGAGIDGSMLGAVGGVQTHTLTIAQIPLHDHQIWQGTYTPAVAPRAAFGDGINAQLGAGVVTSTGGGLAHSSTQPTMIMNKIIKV